jgi:DNA-binding winged helix-turn-helix (wHTH) protein
MRACFGPFSLDTSTREVRRDGEVVHMTTKCFDLLRFLIEGAPQVMSKRQILDAIWPGTYVSDGTLAATVTELRSALEDDAKSPQFVRTVHRVGYAFCAPFVRPDGGQSPAYRLRWGGHEIHLSAGPNILGRDRSAVAWIDDPSISRLHARIEVGEGDVTIEDLGSKNGTFVGGHRIEGRQALHDGDEVMLGKVPMTFRVFRQGLPTETVTS